MGDQVAGEPPNTIVRPWHLEMKGNEGLCKVYKEGQLYGNGFVEQKLQVWGQQGWEPADPRFKRSTVSCISLASCFLPEPADIRARSTNNIYSKISTGFDSHAPGYDPYATVTLSFRCFHLKMDELSAVCLDELERDGWKRVEITHLEGEARLSSRRDRSLGRSTSFIPHNRVYSYLPKGLKRGPNACIQLETSLLE